MTSNIVAKFKEKMEYILRKRGSPQEEIDTFFQDDDRVAGMSSVYFELKSNKEELRQAMLDAGITEEEADVFFQILDDEIDKIPAESL